ncbi:virulence factor BrkB family protein [Gallibacterium salpingitidis]|uniref:virulence factor BrkB family protein n=1 Tax=Gallibacterium salpingitidis TaxID=505341 RepID=UPI000AAF7318|nr:virulence factor BrkB family protein [Gallibacterium salpingitidis]WKS99238.1 virulence factor BrkB family protein [Gallibacterium salpingitidis]
MQIFSQQLIIQRFIILVKVFLFRFKQNKLSQAAGFLTYSTMLAIVPLFMVIFAFFAAFPVFGDLVQDFEQFIFTNFAPSVSNTVEHYMRMFLANTKKMSGVSIIGLIIVALMLIKSIDTTLNDIWFNSKKRSALYSFSIYWMILTLGPIFIATSVGVSSYIFSSSVFTYKTGLPFGLKLLSFVPFLLTWLAFTCIYAVVPNTKVNIKHAAYGALIAAIFFTLGKACFTWYMQAFPSYQLIYGALATLPIMILWIHLSWTFVLLGAQLTAVLDDLQRIKSNGVPDPDLANFYQQLTQSKPTGEKK